MWTLDRPAAETLCRHLGDYIATCRLSVPQDRVLLDPCAAAISEPPQWDFPSACGYDPSSPQHDLTISNLDNSKLMPKCVHVNEPFDWAGDQPLRHPWSKSVIYELHLRGFTIHPKSGVDHPGHD